MHGDVVMVGCQTFISSRLGVNGVHDLSVFRCRVLIQSRHVMHDQCEVGACVEVTWIPLCCRSNKINGFATKMDLSCRQHVTMR